jgi:putative hydrolase of the HAD superfamily
MSIDVVLFDLDDTIYPASNGLMQSIDRRIGEFVQQALGLDEEAALLLRRQYYAEFGTTLRGLQHHHRHIETESYLQYVHDVALDAFLQSDEHLDKILGALPARKAIFTNSPREHAERILQTLGIAEHFERIFDIRLFEFVGKPDPAAYQLVLDELGVEGPDALLIEDTAKNLVPATQFGMTTVLISEELQDSPLADYVVPDVVAAVELAQRLIAAEHEPVRKSAASA